MHLVGGVQERASGTRAGTTSNYHYQRANHRNCLQKPGINTQCNDNNRCRFGFCGNVPSQSCQPNDGDDSDFVIGIGCHGQNDPTTWGAGFNDYYATDGVSPTGKKQVQAWLYAVYGPETPRPAPTRALAAVAP